MISKLPPKLDNLDVETCNQQNKGLDGNFGKNISKEFKFNQSNSVINQRSSKEINVSKGIDEKKKLKSRQAKMSVNNSKNLCEKNDAINNSATTAAINQPPLQKTELLSDKNKLKGLNANEFLDAITSQTMRKRLKDEKFVFSYFIRCQSFIFTSLLLGLIFPFQYSEKGHHFHILWKWSLNLKAHNHHSELLHSRFSTNFFVKKAYDLVSIANHSRFWIPYFLFYYFFC